MSRIITPGELYDEDCTGHEYALSLRLIAYYREVVGIHMDDPVIGTCLICKTSRCQDFRLAHERLICADEGMEYVD